MCSVSVFENWCIEEAGEIQDYAGLCKENHPQVMYSKLNSPRLPMEDQDLPYSTVSSVPSEPMVCACSPVFCVQ